MTRDEEEMLPGSGGRAGVPLASWWQCPTEMTRPQRSRVVTQEGGCWAGVGGDPSSQNQTIIL